MNFIFVPTVITAIIFFIELIICETYITAQFITYCPQFYTFIAPVIYLILALKAKHKTGIIVNLCLILFCCSAFLCYNTGNISQEKLNIANKINKGTDVQIDSRLDCKVYKTDKYDIYIVNCNKPYYSSKKHLAQNIYKFVNKNSKNAIIMGDLGFPARGLNYDYMSKKFKEEKHCPYFKLNDTNYLFYTENK